MQLGSRRPLVYSAASHNLVVTGPVTYNAGPPTSATIARSAVPVDAQVGAPVTGMDEGTGWVAIRLAMGFASTANLGTAGHGVFCFDWRDDSSNFLNLTWRGTEFGSPGWSMGRQAAGAGPDGAWLGDTFVIGDKRTVIWRWTPTVIGMSLAGAGFADLAATAVPVLATTSFQIGSSNINGTPYQIGSDVIWFAWGSGTLTDANAATINGFGDTDHLPADFPGGCLAVWPCLSSAYNVP